MTKHVLEPEDEDARQRRIRIALEKLAKTTSKDEMAPPAKFDFGDRRTFPIEPPDELLSRVQTFLPQIAASNEVLAQRVEADPRSVDIEAIEESDTRVVEMNLGLGVFSIRGPDSQGDSPDSGDSDTDSSCSSSC